MSPIGPGGTMLLLSSLAFAGGTHHVDLDLPEVQAVGERQGYTGRYVWNVFRKARDVVFDSTSPWVTCTGEGHHVDIDVEVHAEALTTLPDEVVCTYRRTRIHLYPASDPTKNRFWEPLQPIVFEDGLEVTQASTVYSSLLYPLPLDRRYRVGEGEAVDADGRPWEGVACEVVPIADGDWALRLKVVEVGPSSGVCRVPSDTDTPHQLWIDIVHPDEPTR